MSRWTFVEGDGPIITTAIHAGHDLRPEVAEVCVLDEATRLMEEDPFTDSWLPIGDNTVATTMSRFEVDLNRPRESAVYREPGDAWGLELWNGPLDEDIINGSLSTYDDFYAEMERLCDRVVSQSGRFVLIDLHSYNHRRSGPNAPVDDPALNPEINVGTGSLDKAVWPDVAKVFSNALASHPFDGGYLDVRENVRFKGGHLSRWINGKYGDKGCALAIEVKKIYVDEWTGEVDETVVVAVGEALTVAVDALRESLGS